MLRKGEIKTEIFIDGGDPGETRKAKEMLGWLDGQTTNPTLIARNLQQAEGKSLTEEDAVKEYKRIVQEMAKIIPQGSISIQVFANKKTSAEAMLAQARKRSKWIPNASIKFPCTKAGLKAASRACREMNVNITLVFTQAQAAAVYEATRQARQRVFISPFVGRLDDQGLVGMDVVANIIKMYAQGDGHVEVLTASVRNLDHLLYALQLSSDIVTLPFRVFAAWAEEGFRLPDADYRYDDDASRKKPIPYDESAVLNQPWQEYDLAHPLTDKGLATFWEDWRGLFGG